MQPGHLGAQVEVGEGLLGELAELRALLGRQRVEQPLLGGGPPGERLDQLVQGLRAVGEQLAVRGHEVVEVVLGVLAAGVGVEHRVEVGEHVA